MASKKPEVCRNICNTCIGLCCTLETVIVVLDVEKVEKRLSKYRYKYQDLGFGEPQPVLAKRKDGSCVYFDHDCARCTIYSRRPAGCRSWFCGKGTQNNHLWKQLNRDAECFLETSRCLRKKSESKRD